MQSSGYVFFIGDVALDEYYSTNVFPRLKEKVIVQTLPASMGGMIANAACEYAGYGMSAKFLAALNGGPVSQRLCEGLRAAGLDISHMVRDDSLPDSKTIIILAEGEHTVFIPTMNLQRIQLSQSTFQAICGADYIYSTFCELRPLRCGELSAAGILKAATDNGCRLWCDLDVADISEADDPLFDYVDTLFVNETGFLNLRGGDSEAELVRRMFRRGIKTFIVTLAENGCRVFSDGHEFTVPGLRVPVVDVTGAGDTFCSSFLYASARTDDLRIRAEFANYAAARAVMGMGSRSGVCDARSVIDFIKEQGGGLGRFKDLV